MNVQHKEQMITIELPREALAPIAETPEAFAKEMRLAAAIEWYREGRISQGRGAESAGLSRIDFLDALFRAKVPACQVTVDELMEEVDRASARYREFLASHSADQGAAP
jgi:predicted HTH domain antitoxin